jgi:multiple sugar transport system permease protein
VIGLLFRFCARSQRWVVNYWLGQIGFSATPVDAPPSLVWVSLVVMTVWWTLGSLDHLPRRGCRDQPRALRRPRRRRGATVSRPVPPRDHPGLRTPFVFVVTVTIWFFGEHVRQAYLTTQGAPAEKTRDG